MYEELKPIRVQQVRRNTFGGLSPHDPLEKTLDELYNQGWWITEIFGSVANLVKKTQYAKHSHPYFCCVQKTIDIKAITPQAARTIKKVQDKQWKKYKHYMLTAKDKRYKVNRDGKV